MLKYKSACEVSHLMTHNHLHIAPYILYVHRQWTQKSIVHPMFFRTLVYILLQPVLLILKLPLYVL